MVEKVVGVDRTQGILRVLVVDEVLAYFLVVITLVVAVEGIADIKLVSSAELREETQSTAEVAGAVIGRF